LCKQKNHKQELLKQISEKEKAREEARQRYLQEGKHIEKELEAEKRKLERLKQQKLQELEKVGVPDKYRTELAKKKVLVASIH